MRYRIDDGRGNVRSAAARMRVRAVVDGDVTVIRTLDWPPGTGNDVNQPPLRQRLPSVGPYSEIDAYFGIGGALGPGGPGLRADPDLRHARRISGAGSMDEEPLSVAGRRWERRPSPRGRARSPS